MNWLVIDKDFNEDNLSDEMKKVYSSYKDAVSKRGMFDSIKFLKRKDVQRYRHECKMLAKTVKYISFLSKTMSFQVRFPRNGIKVYLGTFDNFDEACFQLKEYIKLSN